LAKSLDFAQKVLGLISHVHFKDVELLVVIVSVGELIRISFVEEQLRFASFEVFLFYVAKAWNSMEMRLWHFLEALLKRIGRLLNLVL
jgi:hypothetical protein